MATITELSLNMRPSLPANDRVDALKRNAILLPEINKGHTRCALLTNDRDLNSLQFRPTNILPSGHSIRIKPRPVPVSSCKPFWVKSRSIGVTTCRAFRMEPQTGPITSSRPALDSAISSIVQISPKKQMGRIDTITNVAFMTHQHALRDFRIEEFKARPMRANNRLTIPKRAIAILEMSTTPPPAIVCHSIRRCNTRSFSNESHEPSPVGICF